MQTLTLAALRKQFTRTAGAVFAANALGLLLLFASQVALARALGVQEYGIYTFVLSCAGIVVLVGKLGLDQSLQRFIPQYAGRAEWGYCRGVLQRSFQIAAVAGLVTALLLWFSAPLILSNVDQAPAGIALIMVLVVPVWVLLKVTVGALLAFRQPLYAQTVESILPSLAMIAAALGFMAFAPDMHGSLLMLAGFLAALAGTVLLGLVILRWRAVPEQLFDAAAGYDTWHWIRVAMPLFVMSGMYVIMNYTDIIMVGTLSSTTDSGIYAAASRITALVTMPLVFTNTVLSPYISGLFHAGRTQELQHIVSIASGIAGALALPACLVIFLLGGWLLGFFGTGFDAGRRAMNILLFGQTINVLSGSVGMLLSMTGRHVFAAVTVTFCAALNVLLNYLLIPRFGLEGAALATTVTMVLWNMVFVYRVRTVLNIRSTFIGALRQIW